MRVYHGSDSVVEFPDVNHSYRPLDFGRGFYVTTNRDQAIRWAQRKADINKKQNAYINIYELDSDDSSLKVKTFSDDLEEWIDFVCSCREGGLGYKDFDVIKGNVANDKVFRVVDLYRAGIWDKEKALKEIKVYQGYDQIAFITQEAIDKMLTYISSDEV